MPMLIAVSTQPQVLAQSLSRRRPKTHLPPSPTIPTFHVTTVQPKSSIPTAPVPARLTLTNVLNTLHIRVPAQRIWRVQPAALTAHLELGNKESDPLVGRKWSAAVTGVRLEPPCQLRSHPFPYPPPAAPVIVGKHQISTCGPRDIIHVFKFWAFSCRFPCLLRPVVEVIVINRSNEYLWSKSESTLRILVAQGPFVCWG